MKIAITGGTGFVGRHLAEALIAQGHEPVLLARGRDRRFPPAATLRACDLSDAAQIAAAIGGCEAIAHCAGINREVGAQTYQQVHVEATRNVIDAARAARIGRLLMLSFLRARPDCGSAYHESKFAAEELVRGSGLSYTILKAGMIYGRGDHMLDHLSHTLHTLPVFAKVGFREAPIRPVAVNDVVRIIVAALTGGRLANETVAVLGPETLLLSEAVRRVARVLGRRVLIVPAPVIAHRALAVLCERTMAIPLVSRAQVQMLVEGFLEPSSTAKPLPRDLLPPTAFDAVAIRLGLPPAGAFSLADLRCARGLS